MEYDRLWQQSPRSREAPHASREQVGSALPEETARELVLAAIAVAANDPEAVSLACMMSFLPFSRDHRADADLDN